MGILPVPLLASQAISVREAQVPVYTARSPSVRVPGRASIIRLPEAGTMVVTQRSVVAPYTPQLGGAIPELVRLHRVKELNPSQALGKAMAEQGPKSQVPV